MNPTGLAHAMLSERQRRIAALQAEIARVRRSWLALAGQLSAGGFDAEVAGALRARRRKLGAQLAELKRERGALVVAELAR